MSMSMSMSVVVPHLSEKRQQRCPVMIGALRTRLQSAHRSGNLYLGLSGLSAFSAGALYLATEREAAQRRDLERYFEQVLAAERVKARTELAERDAALRGAPILWSGVLTQADTRLQGYAMLRGSPVGATVDILEENVGQDNKYHTVRDNKTGSTGLHLATWVRKADATTA